MKPEKIDFVMLGKVLSRKRCEKKMQKNKKEKMWCLNCRYTSDKCICDSSHKDWIIDNSIPNQAFAEDGKGESISEDLTLLRNVLNSSKIQQEPSNLAKIMIEGKDIRTMKKKDIIAYFKSSGIDFDSPSQDNTQADNGRQPFENKPLPEPSHPDGKWTARELLRKYGSNKDKIFYTQEAYEELKKQLDENYQISDRISTLIMERDYEKKCRNEFMIQAKQIIKELRKENNNLKVLVGECQIPLQEAYEKLQKEILCNLQMMKPCGISTRKFAKDIEVEDVAQMIIKEFKESGLSDKE